MENQENVKKITLIGANGKIGKSFITSFVSEVPDNEKIEILLIGNGTDESLTRLEGGIKDAKVAAKLAGKKIKFTATNDYKDIKGSDMVICTAGKWPTGKEMEEAQRIDPTGRTIQSSFNAPIISNIASNINEHCPETTFLIVTNQVDTMCDVARENAPNAEVLGLTGAIDSTRLKVIIEEELGEENDPDTAYMIGYHNGDMIPLTSSIQKDGKPIFTDSKENQEKLTNVMGKVKSYGGEISKKNRAGRDSSYPDTGASISPALAVAKIAKVFVFGGNMKESFNVNIKDEKVAKHYGVENNTSLSIPVEITKGKITQLTEYQLTEKEKEAMRKAQDNLNKDKAALKDVLNKKSEKRNSTTNSLKDLQSGNNIKVESQPSKEQKITQSL